MANTNLYSEHAETIEAVLAYPRRAHRLSADDGDEFSSWARLRLLEDDCANYAREIVRVLRPGGTAAISIYLHTAPAEGQAHQFEAQVGAAYVEYPEVPTKLVSYGLDAFERWFEGTEVTALRGRWRRDGTEQTDEWQDWVLARIPG